MFARTFNCILNKFISLQNQYHQHHNTTNANSRTPNYIILTTSHIHTQFYLFKEFINCPFSGFYIQTHNNHCRIISSSIFQLLLYIKKRKRVSSYHSFLQSRSYSHHLVPYLTSFFQFFLQSLEFLSLSLLLFSLLFLKLSPHIFRVSSIKGLPFSGAFLFTFCLRGSSASS